MRTLVEYAAGVVTLVLLTLAVMVGVLATDRTVLRPRHRVLLQPVHSALSVLAVGAVVLHVVSMIAKGYASTLDVLLPFLGGRSFEVGMGALALYLMVSVFWTGLIRARFAGSGRPWLWRVLHSGAYAAWPIALYHGFEAGRAAAAWVELSYFACALAVVATLLARLAGLFARKRGARPTRYVRLLDESTQLRSTPTVRPDRGRTARTPDVDSFDDGDYWAQLRGTAT
ncbi:hypothetical protein SAMN05421812_102695 [Asanoa hainanensis]|uniref:DMSO/TMAO reductase YedYZ, heme-binding membrane subunit n=1 Tax=Asanoa hainanensis TaxID=560556 RepID=A0A239J288_9ACTN|nr:ferric reductase-like transmembrane domain-containing protein [Asanoa hainanensis]SNT00146.1 hypothetical protein SAMN05421812_102695 [Asanoa hainanensis]